METESSASQKEKFGRILETALEKWKSENPKASLSYLCSYENRFISLSEVSERAPKSSRRREKGLRPISDAIKDLWTICFRYACGYIQYEANRLKGTSNSWEILSKKKREVMVLV